MFRQMLIAVSLAGCCTMMQAQAAPTAPKAAMTTIEPSKSFDSLLSVFEKQFLGVANTMPAENWRDFSEE